jgi:16S rRNA processing protein RimM
MAVVARVARPHGNRGEVIVNPATDFPAARFRVGAVVYVNCSGNIESLALTTVRFHRDRPILGLRGIETIDQAERLADVELRVPIDELLPLPAGTFYRHDLIGCRVVTGAGLEVGTVTAVEGELGGSRLVVQGTHGEILIPLAADICSVVDVANRKIVVTPIEGLLDLNA